MENTDTTHYVPSLEKGAQLMVFDPAGRIVRFWELKTTTGVIQWQINGETPKGIYLVSLVSQGKAPETVRFSIIE